MNNFGSTKPAIEKPKTKTQLKADLKEEAKRRAASLLILAIALENMFGPTPLGAELRGTARLLETLGTV